MRVESVDDIRNSLVIDRRNEKRADPSERAGARFRGKIVFRQFPIGERKRAFTYLSTVSVAPAAPSGVGTKTPMDVH